jgi:hypothetical protein
VLEASFGHLLRLHPAFKLGSYQAQVYKIVAPPEGVFVAEIKAWARTIAANVSVYLPGPLEGIVVESAIRASACGKAIIAVNTALWVYKYGHL